MNNYFLGRTADELIGNNFKYFYAIRRNDDGDIWFARVNMLSREDGITINNPGTAADNWDGFETGVDFFEGRDEETRELEYPNLNYEQYRWDDTSIYYYIDDDGQLVARTHTKYAYPSGL